MIRPIILAAVMTGIALPVAAQTDRQPFTPFEMPKAADPAPSPAPGDDPFRFPSRDPGTERGPFDDLFDNMLRRAQPHLEGLARDMGGLMNEYAPVFDELGKLMDDIGNYELPPERLPNGDIIIRRKSGAPPPPPLEELPNFLPKGDGTQQPAPPSPPTPPAPPPGAAPGVNL